MGSETLVSKSKPFPCRKQDGKYPIIGIFLFSFFCIFAARKMNQLLRHIVTIILLASYLPMVIISSLHVHHETIDIPDDCRQCAGISRRLIIMNTTACFAPSLA